MFTSNRVREKNFIGQSKSKCEPNDDLEELNEQAIYIPSRILETKNKATL